MRLATFFLALIILCVPCNAQQDYPDGTVVYSNSIGLIGRIAERLTGGDRYTHIGIVIDGKVYEADWPRITKGSIEKYGKAKSTNDFFVPKKPFSKEEVAKMKEYAESQLGKPYQLRNYFWPNSRPTKGTWCSVFAGSVLNASGRYDMDKKTIFEPQRIHDKIKQEYEFRTRVIRRR